MPTVVLATHEFDELARECARNEGIAEARIVTVRHPIGGASPEALHEKAAAALDAVLALADPAD